MSPHSPRQVDLSILIVHHRNRQLLEQCLDSIYKETSVNFEIIVVDNCSGDGTPEFIKHRYPDITLIQNTKIEGFARNHNKVLKVATGRYLLLLNDDTIILNHALDKMVKFMDRHTDMGILGCKMQANDGRVQTVAYKRFPSALRLFFEDIYGMSGLRKIFPNNWLYNLLGMGTLAQNRSMEVARLNGACMLVRRELIEKIGLFDEQFFMYMEETDLCYRAKLTASYSHPFTIPLG